MKDAGVDPNIIKGVATLAGPFDFLPLDTSATIRTFGKVKDLANTQPINFARSDAPPFLILHGDDDTIVFPRNAKSLYNLLLEAGSKPKLVMYPKISHVQIMLSLSKPMRASAPVLNDVTNFFKDILKQ